MCGVSDHRSPFLAQTHIRVAVNPSTEPLDELTARTFMARNSQQGTKDVKVLYDRSTQLSDGTPAHEAEIGYSWGLMWGRCMLLFSP
jgi:hypothetical protein